MVVSSRHLHLDAGERKPLHTHDSEYKGTKMLDTMTMTKVLGAFCGSLLVLLLGAWAADLLYETGGGHGDHGQQAYLIETGGDEGGATAEEEVDFLALVAEADAAKGERVFGKCKACHKLDGTDGTGPHLNGVVGRDIAAIGGFKYSSALSGLSGQAWDAENLNGFLENPKSWASGTAMAFAGLKKPEDRANLVAYLDSVQ